MPQVFQDAQSALPFVIGQGRNLETTIYQQRYPSFDYASIVPVVTEGNAWAIGTQFQTMDLAGEAKFLSGAGADMPFNQSTYGLEIHDFAMLGSGWEWNIEEINQASMYNRNLNGDKALSASRSIERLLYNIAMTGSAEKAWRGFCNQSNVTTTNAAAVGTGSSPLFVDKAWQQQLADLTALMTGIPRSTNEIEFPDTVAFPPAILDLMASTYVGIEGSSPTVLDRFKASNVYTAMTGQPLNIQRIRDLATAGSDGGGRIIAYRKSLDVVRFHLPMPRLVLPVHAKSIMGFETGIIARTGGTEVRLPGAMAYLDKVSVPA
jgi:hypothetical protein